MNAVNRKKKRALRTLRTVIIVVVVILVLLAVLLFLARRYVRRNFSFSTDTVQSVQVTRGSVSTTVSGSGMLESEGVESVTYPSGVTLDTVYVQEGDTVQEGDLLASVNASSVLTALSEAQTALDELDGEIEAASEDEAEDTITTALSGRVMEVYAREGDDVATVMYDQGALALLSLDGYLALDLEPGSLAEGDAVTVTGSDGTVYDGTVSQILDVATVLIPDDTAQAGDTVQVTDDLGTLLGEGTLYIHSPLKITGYAGKVETVEALEHQAVLAGDTLFSLTDTSYSANYDALLSQRSDLEENLRELISLYRLGGVYAPISGVVDTVTEDTSSAYAGYSQMGESASLTLSSGEGQTTLLSIAPEEQMTVSLAVDETDILSIQVGQEASVTVDSLGEDSFVGTLTEIDTTASSSGGVTQYTVEVTLDKVEGMLSGMTATVTITIEGVEDALLLPAQAVTQTSSTAYVYTAYDESTGELGGMTEVTLGLSGTSYVEIVSGLSEGDTVYYTDSDSGGMGFASMMGGMAGGRSAVSGEASGEGGIGGSARSFGDSMPGGGMDFGGPNG